MSFQTETASFNVTLAASSNLPNNIIQIGKKFLLLFLTFLLYIAL